MLTDNTRFHSVRANSCSKCSTGTCNTVTSFEKDACSIEWDIISDILSENESVSTYIRPRFNCSYLCNTEQFFHLLFEDLNDDDIKKRLYDFSVALTSVGFSKNIVKNKIAKRILGETYLQKLEMTAQERTAQWKLLEKKFYLILTRYLLVTHNYSIAVKDFIQRFQAILWKYQIKQSDEELLYLFRWLSPTLIFEQVGFEVSFFHQKSTLFAELGSFIEYSGSQYNSGGGKKPATKLRYEAYDLITGNVRLPRKRT